MANKSVNLAALALLAAAFFRLGNGPVSRPEPSPLSLVRGTWVWTNGSVFQLQKITSTFTKATTTATAAAADSFYLVQRDIDPLHPEKRLPCSQANYQMYALGKFSITDGEFVFNGQYADSNFSRDTLRLCRNTGFQSRSRYRMRRGINGDTLCFGMGPVPDAVCLTRVRDP